MGTASRLVQALDRWEKTVRLLTANAWTPESRKATLKARRASYAAGKIGDGYYGAKAGRKAARLAAASSGPEEAAEHHGDAMYIHERAIRTQEGNADANRRFPEALASFQDIGKAHREAADAHVAVLAQTGRPVTEEGREASSGADAATREALQKSEALRGPKGSYTHTHFTDDSRAAAEYSRKALSAGTSALAAAHHAAAVRNHLDAARVHQYEANYGRGGVRREARHREAAQLHLEAATLHHDAHVTHGGRKNPPRKRVFKYGMPGDPPIMEY